MEQISDERKKQIQKQAQEILRNFAKSLSKVKIKAKKEHKELGGFRIEGNGMKGDEDFRNRMFDNAQHKSGDSIIAEKKSW